MRTSVDVHNHLVERGVQHELITVRGRLRSADRLAAVLDLPAEQVGRVVVYESDAGPVVALVAADRTPDPERVKRAAKAKELTETTPARASELTDYIPEAIPPVGLPSGIRVLMDRPLASQEVVYVNGGDPAAVLKVRGKDLAKAAGAKLSQLT
jgi:Cys-tRNA(Pro)/Cys-tRNA(Cys) deacylase